MFKVGVLTKRRESYLTEGLSRLFPGMEIEYTNECKQIKSMISKDEVFEIVVDFDVADQEQVAFVNWLNEQDDEGVKYSFWSDLKWKINRKKDKTVVTPLDNSKVDDLIKSLLPIREKVSNKFLTIPTLSITNLEYVQFSHHDGQDLFFISNQKLTAEEFLPVDLTLSADEQEPSIIKCNGELEQAPQDGQDEEQKYYYKLTLDSITSAKLSGFFKSCEQVNEFVADWANLSKADNSDE